MKKLIVKPGLFLAPDKEKTKIEKIEEAWKKDNFIVTPPEFHYEVVDNNVDILKQARAYIESNKNTTSMLDWAKFYNNGLDKALEILDKLIAESEGKMEDKAFTIDELIAFLTKLKVRNCGDYKIVIGERPLYTDEYVVASDKKELIFRGCLYHEDITKKAIKLNNEITKSIEKFYRK